MEGAGLFDYSREGEDHVLLGRMEGNVSGYLSYGVEEGEVLCVFRGVAEAEEFYERWRARIPEEGWGAVRLAPEELIGVVENFDLVSISPRPVPGTTEYLLPADDFVRTLRNLG
jgi:hypothetical protein